MAALVPQLQQQFNPNGTANPVQSTQELAEQLCWMTEALHLTYQHQHMSAEHEASADLPCLSASPSGSDSGDDRAAKQPLASSSATGQLLGQPGSAEGQDCGASSQGASPVLRLKGGGGCVPFSCSSAATSAASSDTEAEGCDQLSRPVPRAGRSSFAASAALSATSPPDSPTGRLARTIARPAAPASATSHSSSDTEAEGFTQLPQPVPRAGRSRFAASAALSANSLSDTVGGLAGSKLTIARPAAFPSATSHSSSDTEAEGFGQLSQPVPQRHRSRFAASAALSAISPPDSPVGRLARTLARPAAPASATSQSSSDTEAEGFAQLPQPVPQHHRSRFAASAALSAISPPDSPAGSRQAIACPAASASATSHSEAEQPISFSGSSSSRVWEPQQQPAAASSSAMTARGLGSGLAARSPSASVLQSPSRRRPSGAATLANQPATAVASSSRQDSGSAPLDSLSVPAPGQAASPSSLAGVHELPARFPGQAAALLLV